MAYVKKDFFINESVKAWIFLVKELDCSQKIAQRIIDKRQLFCEDILVERKSQVVEGKISLLIYEPNPKGLIPVFENEYFAVFEKPSGVLTHPKNRNTEYSLNDEIKSLFGKDANVVHRLDKETSGLIVVSKQKGVEAKLKTLFESRDIEKGYVLLVKGEVRESFLIDESILTNPNYENIKLKVYIDKMGKSSQTFIKPLEYFEDIDATFVEATPKTGRQHQIRVHMFHVKHSIIGDPLYGLNAAEGAKFLDGLMSEEERIKLSGAKRLLLHSHKIKFVFENVEYGFFSEHNAKDEFYKLAKEAYKKPSI